MLTNPTDVLKACLEEPIKLYLKTGDKIKCHLIGFDEHFNIFVTYKNKFMFYRGENIICIGQE